MFVPNHQHLLVKGYFQNPPMAEKTLNDWFIKLVERVDMKVAYEPTSVYVEESGNEGLTGSIIGINKILVGKIGLQSSHGSIHIWSEQQPYLFQFDLYSCKEFDTKIVLNHLDEFGLYDYEYLMIDRNRGFKITDVKKKHGKA